MEQLQKLQQEGVTVAELEKVKNKTESTMAFEDMTVMNRAASLAYYELLGDAALLNQEAEAFLKVKAEDIQRISKETFSQNSSSTLYYLTEENA